MSIEVSNLTKLYGRQKAIDNISFKIDNAEIVGFLGPNGAGKSTTMKILTGFLAADSGNAMVGGLDVRSHSMETKKKTGYLPEGNPLYHEMYVKEYLSFIADVHHLKDKNLHLKKAIEITGLTPESKKKIGQLSKGYKQRVGLAAALIHDPEVLILDEPTSGLDPNQIVEIREVIKNLGQNKTVLFSSHILQEVEAICDRVIIINKGNIVADNRLSDLQNNKKDLHIVLVEFKEAVDINIINGIKEVERVEQLQTTYYKLQTSNPESVKKQLLQLSLLHNLNIISLQSESESLEEIFKNLTN
ncbi:MAG: gliding motility-associated ABC transporter ATP-binding subunit GldA [Chitinophagaceae bacterium]|nr:gliding motility-associated ABC transporter ATP-binding subunit GldA [Chitinophagaceae bacterium]